MLGRRKFLGVMAASPLAAKAAAAELAGVSALGAETLPGSMLGASGDLDSKLTAIGVSESWAAKALNWIGKNGIPEFRLRELEKMARVVTRLDPDLASNCWSLSVKIQEQRVRNLERMKQEFLDRHNQGVDCELFHQQHGFWI